MTNEQNPNRTLKLGKNSKIFLKIQIQDKLYTVQDFLEESCKTLGQKFFSVSSHKLIALLSTTAEEKTNESCVIEIACKHCRREKIKLMVKISLKICTY